MSALRRVAIALAAVVVLGAYLAGRDATATRVIALALVGAGLGAFTPANNTAIMRAAPRQGAGAAGGVINMTRGLGTSIGVALCGSIYVFAQLHAAHAGSESGFIVTVLALIVLSTVAALT